MRVCGKRCCYAKGAKCRCWCGGLFHGGAGAPAREAFRREFGLGKLPTTEVQFDHIISRMDLFRDAADRDKWRSAVAAAVAARAGGVVKQPRGIAADANS